MRSFQPVCFTLLFTLVFCHTKAQLHGKIVISFDQNIQHQTVQNFAASDAWACQFVGNWPEVKKNTIADWLFSSDTLPNGNPKGIGLSMWRYNLGAGSAEQKDVSGIKDEWRRAALTTGESPNVQAQNWFLQAAKKRGVQQFLGFYNSPPVQLTRNGKAYADKGHCNLDSSQYKAFAAYTVEALEKIRKSTGVLLDYISPVNEPQWDWSDGGQEGCPYTNMEISRLVRSFSNIFQQNKLPTKLLITEAGHLKYLLQDDDKPDKGNQIDCFFQPSSPEYIGDLTNVNRSIAAHSYFTTSPFQVALSIRTQVKDRITNIKGLQFWQSEYCILGDNNGEINGNKRDLGMGAALYVAAVIYEDLVGANASSWHWWTALSAYDYKDGLVYIDKNKNDGHFMDSKMLWALGNYSFFVRPGMKRIEVSSTSKELLVSAFKNDNGRLVIIIVNPTTETKALNFQNNHILLPPDKLLNTYTTDASTNLGKHSVPVKDCTIGAQSVMSVVID